MTSSWIQSCFIIAFIIFAECVISGVGFPVETSVSLLYFLVKYPLRREPQGKLNFSQINRFLSVHRGKKLNSRVLKYTRFKTFAICQVYTQLPWILRTFLEVSYLFWLLRRKMFLRNSQFAILERLAIGTFNWFQRKP